MKLLIMIFTAIAGIFQLFFPTPEQTDWFRDGEYVGFYLCNAPEEKTMEKLLELAGAGDTESVCEVFSRSARREIEDLPGQAAALIAFLTEETASWETERAPHSQADNVIDRCIPYTLARSDGSYECLIRDTMGVGGGGDHVFGFDNISIYPEELGTEYAGLGADVPGIFIVRRAAGENDAAVQAGNAMEELLAEDAESLRARFPEDAEGSEEDAAALLDFLDSAAGWEPYAWSRWETGSGWNHVVREDALLHLQTAAGTYRCDIRATEDRFGSALYSVTVFPSPNPGEIPDYEDVYREYCVLGKESPGIFLVREGE